MTYAASSNYKIFKFFIVVPADRRYYLKMEYNHVFLVEKLQCERKSTLICGDGKAAGVERKS